MYLNVCGNAVMTRLDRAVLEVLETSRVSVYDASRLHWNCW
jgi:hypothetical protein